MRRRSVSVSLVALLGLGVAACGDEGTAGSAGSDTTASATVATATTEPATTAGSVSTDPSTGAPASSAAPTVVPEVLQFSAPLVGGGTFDGAAVAGTPLALWFWAPG